MYLIAPLQWSYITLKLGEIFEPKLLLFYGCSIKSTKKYIDVIEHHLYTLPCNSVGDPWDIH